MRKAIAWIIGTLFVGALIVFVVQDHNRWERWCRAQGGHVISNTKTVNTVDSKGKPGVGSEITYYCLNESGGIIDIR